MVRLFQRPSSLLSKDMFTLCVLREFSAQHYLIGGDRGAENLPHAHEYRLELRLQGERLNEHGFLLDIVEIEAQLDREVGSYQDDLLNELPAFADHNPSLENFSQILCLSLAKPMDSDKLSSIEIRLWENKNAWASYRLDF